MNNSKLILIVLGIGFAVYLNSLRNGFIWDDYSQILNNTLVHSIENLQSFFSGSTFAGGGREKLPGLYYRPLMVTSFSLLYTLFGPNPLYFHLFQILIHLANAVFVLLLFRHFFNKTLSLFLALIFLVHPMNAEAVSYISALQDPLFFFFGQVALLLTMRKRTTRFLVMASVLFIFFSLLSKESGLLFVLVITTCNVLFEKRNKLSYLFYTGVVSVLYFFLRFNAIGGIQKKKTFPAPIMEASFQERLLTIPKEVYFYLKTFFFPKDLAISQHWIVKATTLMDFYLPFFALAVFILLTIFLGLTLKDKNSKKLYIFFTVWLLLGLGLHLQLFPLDFTVADRYFYFPMVGLLGMIGFWTQCFVVKTKKAQYVLIVLAISIIATLSTRTVLRTVDWKNNWTLFSHDVKLSKASFDLETNLCAVLADLGRYHEAKTHCENSVKLSPKYWVNWNNLGTIYERQGDYNKAKESYERAIANGHFFVAYENLSNLLLFHQNNPHEAREVAMEALRGFPKNHKLWLLLALSEYKSDNKRQALLAAKKSYTLLPTPTSKYVYFQLVKNLPIQFKQSL